MVRGPSSSPAVWTRKTPTTWQRTRSCSYGDETVDVEVDGDEALLYPALDAGVDIPYAGEAGTHGQRTVKYDGDADEVVTHEGNDYLNDDQIADGRVSTCIAYASADSELEVAHPDDA